MQKPYSSSGNSSSPNSDDTESPSMFSFSSASSSFFSSFSFLVATFFRRLARWCEVGSNLDGNLEVCQEVLRRLLGAYTLVVWKR